MKKLLCFCALAVFAACSHESSDVVTSDVEMGEYGKLSVLIEHEQSETKALTGYTTALDDEKKVYDISVFVFDKSTGVLNAYRSLDSLSDECEFDVTVGDKIIYAVVNGPEVGGVTNVNQLKQAVDNLSGSSIGTNGLVMVGSQECKVEAGKLLEPVVVVKRLVARVVLQKVTNSVAPQYGSITVDCVYLGNANTSQTISGVVSGMVNPNGYSDSSKTKPIGKDGVTGSCPAYLYRAAGTSVANGANNTTKYHMYCQPSTSGTVTCLYILATIGGGKYYYRVPLQNGLKANTTCSVEVEIVNLGAALPPDGDIQKGEIVATVSISGWDAGDSYVVEF